MMPRDTSIDGLTLDEMDIGDKAYIQKTVTEHDIYTFAGVTGDFNVAHVNEEIAKKNMFGQRIAHGALTSGLISAVLGMKLPGAGCLYISQTSKFIRPVKIGDTIKAEAEVIKKIPEKNRVIIKTTCTNQNGDVVLIGEAEIMPRKK
ncbi:MaoC family dehydratase [Caldisalinibacter kiritimatiensis]|uniref:3-hydroxybutyryl-CoA dehydratase n=1 Tax=Caldisalinibacter kiritimatiensis TaxID=1304284 RepID=R1AUN2_9FIRM|nr:3-hydroxybutyryl-CoA dehydratase [Caldisalinibacter kiritimatiensis]